MRPSPDAGTLAADEDRPKAAASWPAPANLALRSIVAPLRIGRDPTMRMGPRDVWRASHTPDGPATLHLRLSGATSGGTLEARAWGPGATWAVSAAPALAGLHDDPTQLEPQHRVVERAAHARPGLRIGASGMIYDSIVQTILGQKVTFAQCAIAWTGLVRRYGQTAPGPPAMKLRLAPTPARVAQIPAHDWHRLGVERKRATVIREACLRIDRLEEATSMPRAQAHRRLQAISGVGPWTSNLVLGMATGDPDCLPIGDFHVPNTVSWHLAGEPRGNDDRMLELLQPYLGQRGRVTKLLSSYGGGAPAYGPKFAPQRIEAL